jgi:Phage integrase family
MDPVALIVTALTAGAASALQDGTSAVLKDAYARLKILAKKRIAGRPKGEMVLAEHAAAPQVWQIAAGTLWQDRKLIFASEVGTPMDPGNFSHSFARLCERAVLGHWHPHELRHSGARSVGQAGLARAGASAARGEGVCPIGEFGGDPEQLHCGMPLRSNCEDA